MRLKNMLQKFSRYILSGFLFFYSSSISLSNEYIDPDGYSLHPDFLYEACTRKHQKLASNDRNWGYYFKVSNCLYNINDKNAWGTLGMGIKQIYYFPNSPYNEPPTNENIKKGINLLRDAAKRGNPKAQLNLIQIYSDTWLEPKGYGSQINIFKRYGIKNTFVNEVLYSEFSDLLIKNPSASDWDFNAVNTIGLKIIEKENELTQKQEHKEMWETYRSRDKTILEQVMNYSDMGLIEGREQRFWISDNNEKCIVEVVKGDEFNFTLNVSRIDIRELNQTAFRVDFDFNTNKYIMRTEEVYFRVSANNVDGDRLQKAWRLAFSECPGKKSAF